MAFTDRSIQALRPKAKRYEAWEGGGFGVRVTPKSRKSFIWLYRFNGKPRRMTFGRYPGLGLADARIRLAEAKKVLEQGKDPGAGLVIEKRAERNAETVAGLAAEYIEKHAKLNKKTWQEDERLLAVNVTPVLGRKKAKDVTRRDIIELLDGIVARGAPVAANRVLAVVRKLFNWAIGRDILDANPCSMIQPPAKESPRERVLTADEIKSFWLGLDKAKMADTSRLALRFILATAQRRGEVTGAEWDEFENDIWTIPPEKSKNSRAHRVPLSPLAKKLLKQIRAKAGDSGFLFPSPRRDSDPGRVDKPITPLSVTQAVRNNRDVLKVKDVRPHDLRRTAASHMTSLGIPRLVVAKILNHAEPGVTAVYDRHGYDAEKKHALDTWGSELESIIESKRKRGNVVRLKRA